MTMSKSFGRPYPPSQRVVEYERNIQTWWFWWPRNVLTFKCTFPTFRYLLERSIWNIRLDLNVLLVLSWVSLDDYFINSILHQFTIKWLWSLWKNEVDLPVDPIEVADFASGIFLAWWLVNLIARFSNKNLRHLISSRKEKVKFQDRDIWKISDNFLSEKVSLSKKCKVVNIIKHNARKSAVVETKIDLNLFTASHCLKRGECSSYYFISFTC